MCVCVYVCVHVRVSPVCTCMCVCTCVCVISSVSMSMSRCVSNHGIANQNSPPNCGNIKGPDVSGLWAEGSLAPAFHLSCGRTTVAATTQICSQVSRLKTNKKEQQWMSSSPSHSFGVSFSLSLSPFRSSGAIAQVCCCWSFPILSLILPEAWSKCKRQASLHPFQVSAKHCHACHACHACHVHCTRSLTRKTSHTWPYSFRTYA